MPENTAETAIAVSTDATPAALNLFSLEMFREAWTVAEQLAKSKLIPQNFQNNPPDCIIAMEMAQRIGASIFSVMQSLYIVHGRPGWSAQFIIAALNSCGRFSPLRFDMVGEGDAKTCTAWALEKGTNEKLTGPPVSIDMAKREGWYSKNGSKWQTMPELMLRYRAATFFGRLYAPDILMGMRTAEELRDSDDIIDVKPESETIEELNRRFNGGEQEKTVEPAAENPPVQQEEAAPQDPPADDPPAGDDQEQGTPSQFSTRVKSFVREINQASSGGSISVDTWRAKHHNRVANACGGVESEDYKQVMEFADMTYRELVESEEQQPESR